MSDTGSEVKKINDISFTTLDKAELAGVAGAEGAVAALLAEKKTFLSAVVNFFSKEEVGTAIEVKDGVGNKFALVGLRKEGERELTVGAVVIDGKVIKLKEKDSFTVKFDEDSNAVSNDSAVQIINNVANIPELDTPKKESQPEKTYKKIDVRRLALNEGVHIEPAGDVALNHNIPNLKPSGREVS